MNWLVEFCLLCRVGICGLVVSWILFGRKNIVEWCGLLMMSCVFLL